MKSWFTLLGRSVWGRCQGLISYVIPLVTPDLNRVAKGDLAVADWMPERDRCWFAGTVIAVRRKYGLSADERERQALTGVLVG